MPGKGSALLIHTSSSAPASPRWGPILGLMSGP
jgi:hypothetical protein